MNLTDIIALAKQGYKPSDIKELLSLAATSDSGTATEDPGPDQSVPAEQAPGDSEESEEVQDRQEESPADPDYKKLYEDLKKETQRKNVRENSQQQEEKTLDEKMADLIRSIM